MIKKIITTIVLCSLASITQAEYKISIGLTDKHQGALTDNSIIIKNKTSTSDPIPDPKPPVVVPPERCFYTPNVNSWRTTVGGGIIAVYWDGVQIFGYDNSGDVVTTFTSNGYRYTKDQQQTFAGPPFFKVCRDLILL